MWVCVGVLRLVHGDGITHDSVLNAGADMYADVRMDMWHGGRVPPAAALSARRGGADAGLIAPTLRSASSLEWL